MDRPRGFTLVELLVVISIIALLLSILMPALSKIRKQAKSVICQSNLDQWGKIFLMYANDNDGYFSDGCPRQWVEPKGLWMNALRQYHDISEGGISCCPVATEPVSEGGRQPFAAWGVFDGSLRATGRRCDCWGVGDYGSYGINQWAYKQRWYDGNHMVFGGPLENYWGTPNVKGAANVPLFFDSDWSYIFAHDTESPPQYYGEKRGGSVGWADMSYVCIDRHDGFINAVFLDFSVRKVGLKELWMLKWSRQFDTNGPWTTAGGVMVTDWPEWMRRFKDY